MALTFEAARNLALAELSAQVDGNILAAALVLRQTGLECRCSPEVQKLVREVIDNAALIASSVLDLHLSRVRPRLHVPESFPAT